MFTILDILRESRFYGKFVAGIAALILVHVVGTIGYMYVGFASGEDPRFIDALYMTFITVATIGYAEVYDMTELPWARVFTMFIGFVGIGTTWYLFSTFTAFILETNLSQTYRRRRMLRTIAELSGHYIVCGIGRVGGYVADELLRTERRFVVIDSAADAIAAHEERTGHELHIHGDAADDEVLIAAGIQRCVGVFAVTGDDSRNLVVSMSARALRPEARIVARVHDRRNMDKTLRAGADEIVSPDFTGGMRIASVMLRPHAVTFMDMMLRTENNLRVEEITVPEGTPERLVSTVPPSRDHLVVAIQRKDGTWRFNPSPGDRVTGGDCVIAIVSPTGRREVEKALATPVKA